jgi:hypothetical protein
MFGESASGRRRRQVAEADIGKECPFRQIHPQNHMQSGTRSIDSQAAHDAGLQARDRESKDRRPARNSMFCSKQ